MFDNTLLFRPTYAFVDLSAIAHNFNVLQSMVPYKVGLLGMVKADAYGHGAIEVSKVLLKCGACALGVATVEEGIELRGSKIDAPILVMGGLVGMGGSAADEMVKADLTPVIHSVGVVNCLEDAAAKEKKLMPVHIKVDTGMSRLGVRPESLSSLLEALSTCKWIQVQGVMTHFANASDKEYTSYQMKLFFNAKDQIENKLGSIPIWHLGNSAAIAEGAVIGNDTSKQYWVRPGIGLYGSADGVDIPKSLDLKPAMGLYSKVALLKRVPKGTAVSYGCTFITSRNTRLAVIPIGYADGYRFIFANKACVLIRGKRASVIGRITMDMIMVDVTEVDGISVGDEVVLIGRQGKESITADEMALWADTISYEIFCGISKRIPRVYSSRKTK